MAISSLIRMFIVRLASFFYLQNRSKAIFYHDIHSLKQYTFDSTPIEKFKKHIEIIRSNGYEIVKEITKPFGQVEISFDDGYLGIYDNIEVIKELNIPIQLFVVSSFLDKDNYINKNQLIFLNTLPQIRISSHTHSHKILTKMDSEDLKFELFKSKKKLEKILNCKINAISFPFGRFNKNVIEESKKIGYTKQYIGMPGFYNKITDFKRRSLIHYLANEKEFKAILKGGDHVLSFWYQMKHSIL